MCIFRSSIKGMLFVIIVGEDCTTYTRIYMFLRGMGPENILEGNCRNYNG